MSALSQLHIFTSTRSTETSPRRWQAGAGFSCPHHLLFHPYTNSGLAWETCDFPAATCLSPDNPNGVLLTVAHYRFVRTLLSCRLETLLISAPMAVKGVQLVPAPPC